MTIQQFIIRISRLIYKSIHAGFDCLLPATCLLCGFHSGSNRLICNPCLNDLPMITHQCRQCAQILPETADRHLCGICLRHPPPFDHAYALLRYEPPVIQLITRLKFQGQLSHAALLADLLLQRIQSVWYQDLPLPQLLIPVPLHPQRITERGFNQSIEIARPISRALGIPLDLHGIERIRKTAPQSSISGKERAKNMRNAFKASRRYDGLSIAVIDDVMTTGHTLRSLCAELKKAGASEVTLWCAARTQGHSV